MKTNMSEQELFTVSRHAARLSNQSLEDIAVAVSESPEFPARLSQALQMAFGRSCFQLILRSGNGQYEGFEEPAMRRVGAFYAQDFVGDESMKVELQRRLYIDDELPVEPLDTAPLVDS